MSEHASRYASLGRSERDLLQRWWESGRSEPALADDVSDLLRRESQAESYLEDLDRLDQQLSRLWGTQADAAGETAEGVAKVLSLLESEAPIPPRTLFRPRVWWGVGIAAGLILAFGWYRLQQMPRFDQHFAAVEAPIEEDTAEALAAEEDSPELEMARARGITERMPSEPAAPGVGGGVGASSRQEAMSFPLDVSGPAAGQDLDRQLFFEESLSGVASTTAETNAPMVDAEAAGAETPGAAPSDLISLRLVPSVNLPRLGEEDEKAGEQWAFGLGTAKSGGAGSLALQSRDRWLLSLDFAEVDQWVWFEQRLNRLVENGRRRSGAAIEVAEARGLAQVAAEEQESLPWSSEGQSDPEPAQAVPARPLQTQSEAMPDRPSGSSPMFGYRMEQGTAAPSAADDRQPDASTQEASGGPFELTLKGDRQEILQLLADLGLPLWGDAADAVGSARQRRVFNDERRDRQQLMEAGLESGMGDLFAGEPTDEVTLVIRLDLDGS